MLKKLFALFQRKKKTMPEPVRAETHLPDLPHLRANARMEQRLQQQRARTPASRSPSPIPAARHDDSLTNPLNPLSPLNPMNSPDFHRRADAWIESRCDDGHRSSAGNSGGSDHSSGCSSSSSDSGSSCSSSCD